MTELTDLFRHSLTGGSLLALPLAVAGGLAAGLNPCCLPLYPAAVATCCTVGVNERAGVVWKAVAFVLGGALAMAVLGALAAWAGRALTGLGGWVMYVIALVPLLMGLHLLGWLRLPLPRVSEQEPKVGIAGAFLVGLLLSMVLAPCGTPFLASALSYAAYLGSAPYGMVLLFLYGLGAGLPVLLIGTAAGVVTNRFQDAWRPWTDRLAGLLFLGLGFYLLSQG